MRFATELAAARSAQEAWCRLPVRDRLRPVRSLRALLVERTDDLVLAVGQDIARSPVEVVATELLPSAAALKFLEQRAARVLAPTRIGWGLRPTWLMGCRDVVHRRPWGVVGVIGTWNYPVFLNVGPIAQALIAGNAVLWKPSENAPRTAELTHALFREAGFPAGLLQRLPATREAGPQLAEADIDFLVFTGSDAVGRKLAARLGERLVPSTLELSGCDAMFVLADADLDLAAKAAWFAVSLNRGQTCIAVRRVFVQRLRYAEFLDKVRGYFEAAQPVPLVTAGQRTQAADLVADAVTRGAQPIGGRGDGPEGSVYPTLLADLPADARFCTEACFAPVAGVIPFETIDDAVSLAKRSGFGLGASVFTADTTAAQDLAARLPAGVVTVNDVLAPTAHPATPFGGRGQSGWGVTQGAEGLLGLTVPQVVTVRKGSFRPHLDEAVRPHPVATYDIMRGLLRWTHARGLREKLRGLRQMIGGARRKR